MLKSFRKPTADQQARLTPGMEQAQASCYCSCYDYPHKPGGGSCTYLDFGVVGLCRTCGLPATASRVRIENPDDAGYRFVQRSRCCHDLFMTNEPHPHIIIDL